MNKILVTGKDEAGTTVEFDLLKDRMFTIMNYQWVPDDRELWKTRSDALKALVEQKKSEEEEQD